jgi:hypothetical protein
LTFLTNCLTIRIGNALWKQTYDDMQWRFMVNIIYTFHGF